MNPREKAVCKDVADGKKIKVGATHFRLRSILGSCKI
jgi:hypothetical protein